MFPFNSLLNCPSLHLVATRYFTDLYFFFSNVPLFVFFFHLLEDVGQISWLILATLFQPIGAKLSSKKKILRTLCLTLLRFLASLPCLLLTQDQLPIRLNRFSHPWELSRILLKVLNQLRLILLKLCCFLPSFHPTLKLFEWKMLQLWRS